MFSLSIPSSHLRLLGGLLCAAFPGRTGATSVPLRGTDGNMREVPAALSLADAVRLALENNPALHAAGSRSEEIAGRAAQLGRHANPELELVAEEWPWQHGRGLADAKQTIGLTQPLLYPGKRSLDRQIGGAEVQAGRAEWAGRRVELIRDVKIAYARALAAGRAAEVAAQLADVAEATATVARRRVEAGAAAFQEQLRAEVQHEQARSALADRQTEATEVRRFLATLLGRPDLDETPLADRLAEAVDAAVLGAAGNGDPTVHPTLQVAQAGLDRADAAYRRARLEPMPDPTVGVNAGRLGATGEAIIGVRLSIPLPVADRGQGRQRAARAALNGATAELRAAQQNLQRDRAAAAQRYRAAGLQVARYRERTLPKAEEALRLVRAGFEQGKFGFTDLLDTQRTIADVRLAYLHQVLELNLAQAELESLNGGPPAAVDPAESGPLQPKE